MHDPTIEIGLLPRDNDDEVTFTYDLYKQAGNKCPVDIWRGR